MEMKMPRKPAHAIACEFFQWRLIRRDGVYYADGRTGRLNLGKHSLGTRDLDKALTELRDLDRRMAVQHGLAQPALRCPSSDLSITEGWELFLVHCQRPEVLGGVSPRTSKRYKAVRDKHVSYCDRHGIRLWNQVSKDAANAYGTWLHREQYADRSIYLELTLIKSVILWLIAEKRLSAERRLLLEVSKPRGTDTYCYTPEQVAAMIRHCRQQHALHWLADVLVALVCSGLRIGELASLRATDLDDRLTMIRLTDERASPRRREIGTPRRIKGRRDRALPIHPDLAQVLRRMPRHKDGLLFHGPRGGRLKPDTARTTFVREVIEPLKKKFPTPPGEIGFEHGRLHSCRHFFVSQAFLGGAAEADIRDWLGHRDSRMVAHYRHVRDADSQRKMQQIDFLGGSGRA
jgi:integrase